jgi:hypothetical protein
MDKLGFVAKADSDRCAILKDGVLAHGQATVYSGLLTGGSSRLDCVNPECAAQFNFRQGRIFRFYRYHSMGNAPSMNQYSLKHYWLCKKCTEVYTLEYQEGMGLLIPLSAPRSFSAVVHSEAPLLRGSTSVRQAAKPQNRSSQVGWNKTRTDAANTKPVTYAAKALLSWLVTCVGILTH